MQLALPLEPDERELCPPPTQPAGWSVAVTPSLPLLPPGERGGRTRGASGPVERRDEPSRGASDPRLVPPPAVPVPPSWPPTVQLVRHLRARRYIIRVAPDGTVRVTMPRRGSVREAHRCVERQRHWIERQQARLRAHRVGGPAPLTPEAIRLARKRAAPVLRERLLELAAQHGLHVTSVSVRNQRSRWGSCGPDGSICLNWRLAEMPPDVRDYVLLHELMHLRVRDHSPRFWAAVREVCPGYEDARRWLRVHGRTLL